MLDFYTPGAVGTRAGTGIEAGTGVDEGVVGDTDGTEVGRGLSAARGGGVGPGGGGVTAPPALPYWPTMVTLPPTGRLVPCPDVLRPEASAT